MVLTLYTDYNIPPGLLLPSLPAILACGVLSQPHLPSPSYLLTPVSAVFSLTLSILPPFGLFRPPNSANHQLYTSALLAVFPPAYSHLFPWLRSTTMMAGWTSESLPVRAIGQLSVCFIHFLTRSLFHVRIHKLSCLSSDPFVCMLGVGSSRASFGSPHAWQTDPVYSLHRINTIAPLSKWAL